jgi:uncharacterized protein (DUF1330 family)
MRKLTTTAIAAACLMLGAGGATFYTSRAATGPTVYTVYEANVTDEAAYAQAVMEAQKIIKDNGGVYIAGGFNKARLADGKPPVGNRYVIIKWENQSAFDRAEDDGIRAWIAKNAPQARQVVVEGIEQK